MPMLIIYICFIISAIKIVITKILESLSLKNVNKLTINKNKYCR